MKKLPRRRTPYSRPDSPATSGVPIWEAERAELERIQRELARVRKPYPDTLEYGDPYEMAKNKNREPKKGGSQKPAPKKEISGKRLWHLTLGVLFWLVVIKLFIL